MFDNLTSRLSGVIKTLRGEARLTETNIQEALREVRMALLEADVALPVVKEFIARVKEKAVGKEVIGSLSPGQALVGVVHQELIALMGGEKADINLATVPPAVILMAGLQGAGKTTSSGKIGQVVDGAKKEKSITGFLRHVSPRCHSSTGAAGQTNRRGLLPGSSRATAERNCCRCAGLCPTAFPRCNDCGYRRTVGDRRSNDGGN